MNMNENELLTSEEVMAMLKISKSTLLRWIRNGRLRAHRAGEKLLRFRRDEVLKMLREYEVQPTSSQTPRSQAVKAVKAVKIAEPERVARVKSLRGVFAHLPGGSETFMSEKRKEVEEEKRRWQSWQKRPAK